MSNPRFPSRAESQLEFFPERATVTRFEPAEVAGSQTRVRGIYSVKFERERAIHQVFHDRHGWYCAEHGPACRAVREVTARPR